MEDNECRHSANGPQGTFQGSSFVNTLSRLSIKTGEFLTI